MYVCWSCIHTRVCMHTHVHLSTESLLTSLFRIELYMCTTRCSVRLVKHEPIVSQRIQFEILFSVTKVSMDSWVWTNDPSVCNSIVRDKFEEHEKPAVPREKYAPGVELPALWPLSYSYQATTPLSLVILSILSRAIHCVKISGWVVAFLLKVFAHVCDFGGGWLVHGWIPAHFVCVSTCLSVREFVCECVCLWNPFGTSRQSELH